MHFDTRRLILGGIAIALVRSVLTVVIQRTIVASLFLDEVMQRVHESIASLESTPKFVFVVIALLTGCATSFTYCIMRSALPSRWLAVVGATVPLWLLASMQWLITAAMGLFSWQHVIIEAALMLPASLVATYAGGLVVDAGGSLTPFGRSGRPASEPPHATS